MNARQREDLGEAIQNHIRRKWHFKEQWSPAADTERVLDEGLEERIYILGVDDRLLLEVEPKAVIERLEELEAAGILEDGGCG